MQRISETIINMFLAFCPKIIWDVEIKNELALQDSLSKLIILTEFIRTLNDAILLGKNIRKHFGWKAAIKYKPVLVDNQIDLITTLNNIKQQPILPYQIQTDSLCFPTAKSSS